MVDLFIFGMGYAAKYIAASAMARGWRVAGTGRDGNVQFADRDGVARALSKASHVLSSVPPDRGAGGADPVLETYGALLKGKALHYLSSTGVYGDAQGAWVDESAPIGTGRRQARSDCDAAWLDRGARVYRLPGIYGPDTHGPGRSPLDRVRDGTARCVDAGDQVFSRVHVDDIASGVMAGMAHDCPPGAYNLADDLPAPQHLVIAEAARLLGCEPPPLVPLDDAGLSDAARGFYSENRRVANGKAKRVLGWRPAFSTYREGLRALI
jgi:nucleoside-diphosphate-sugar epimerase